MRRFTSLFKFRTTFDEDADKGDGQNSPRDNINDSQKENIDRKLSMQQRLVRLSGFRISSRAIRFTSGDSGGSGGKADVVRAKFRRWYWIRGQLVAVKKLRSVHTKKARNEFIHEVELMAGLSHENIVRLVGFFEDLENGKAWIILSWQPNGNVSEFLATGDWEIPERVSLIKDTFEGIKYLHTRRPPICHGDLKSLNILISPAYRAVISDFGSAREINESQDKAIRDEGGQDVQGSPTVGQESASINVSAAGDQLTLTGPAWSLRWASPEVMSGDRPGLLSDVWAAGWVCWELMTDKVPFPELETTGGIVLKVVEGKVPSPREQGQLGQIMALCSLMTDCWAFNPKARPSISQCCDKLQWMPSVVPLGQQSSGSKVPSTDLLFEKGLMLYDQSDYKKATLVFQRALSLARSADDQADAANALRWLGHVYRLQGKYNQAEESYTGAQQIYSHIDDDEGRAHTLDGLGEVYRTQSKYTQAEESFRQAEEIYTRSANDLGQANALLGRGEVYRLQSEYTSAEQSFARAQETFTRIGNDLGRALALNLLGKVYRAQSKYAEAEESLTGAREIYARIGNDQGRANAFRALGDVYRFQSKYSQAEESYKLAQEIYTRIGDDLGRATTLRDIGHVRLKQDRNAEAAAHYTDARDLFARLGMTEEMESVSHSLAAVF